MVVGSIPTGRTKVISKGLFWKKSDFEGPLPTVNRPLVQKLNKNALHNPKANGHRYFIAEVL
jgi:hypothetical protein